MYPAKILLMEDDRIIAEDISSMLTSQGYLVVLGYPEISRRGDAMRDYIDHIVTDSDIALVLMDIDLRSEFDGVDFVTYLQTRSDIPVIYLSGQDQRDTVLRAKATQPYGYLLKPFNPNQLYSQIESALQVFPGNAGKKHSVWQLQTGSAGIKTSFDWLKDFGFEKDQVHHEEDFLRIVSPEDQAIVREVFSILKRKLLTKHIFEYRLTDPKGRIRRLRSKLVDSRKDAMGEFGYTILSSEIVESRGEYPRSRITPELKIS